MSDKNTDAIKVLASAKRVAVLTGAGISAESGIPTFRGKDGIWNKIRPEQLASMDAFLREPELVRGWYNYRRKIVLQAKPNAAHITLAKMEQTVDHLAISTQNVDGLHKRAGSSKVLELHGNILRDRCNDCGRVFSEIDRDYESLHCECSGLIRPDVVWFGEMLPEDVLEESFEEARNADVYFSIGTAATVFPAAQLPIEALNSGAYVIEVNIKKTSLTPYIQKHFSGQAGQVLPQILKAVLKEKNRNNE